MQLVIEKPTAVFDLAQIKPGYLFYGKHRTWSEGKSGIVTSATEKQLTVQYFPGLANITNHFFIPAEEVTAGEWDVRYSADMSEVYCFAGEETGKGDAVDESGGTDL